MPLSDFAGTWKLTSSELRASNGENHFPLGKECEGRLVVDTQGNFAAQLMRPGRPEFASGDLLRGTDAEVRAAYQGYVAYWSKIELDEENKQLNYKVAGSLFPNWIGQTIQRYYEFSGNCLTLRTPPFLMGGQETVGVLSWERVT